MSHQRIQRTNRQEAEKEVLQKAYVLFPHLDDTSAKINILCTSLLQQWAETI